MNIYWLKAILGLLLSTAVFSSQAKEQAFWSHIEYAAGNYGEDGYSLRALEKTVIKNLSRVKDKKDFFNQLKEFDSQQTQGSNTNLIPEKQYAILFFTLDQLVKKLGPKGVFHINDLIEEYADYAADKLKAYATSKGYHSVIIETVPGDYTTINPVRTLAPYNLTRYNSAHLKNPDCSLFFSGTNGKELITTDARRARARRILRLLANNSHTGLYLFIADVNHTIIPIEEKNQFIDKKRFYEKLDLRDQWQPMPYIYPEGDVIDSKYSSVYHIQPLY